MLTSRRLLMNPAHAAWMPAAQLIATNRACFSKWKEPSNEDILDKEFAGRERQLFKEKLTKKQQDAMQVQRMVFLQQQKEAAEDKNTWWARLAEMNREEFQLLPVNFARKYGGYVGFLQRYQAENNLDENKSLEYYKTVKSLQKLQTEEEKAQMLREYQKSFEPDVVQMEDLTEKPGDYMRRQPRIDLSKLSYNFEQFPNYSKQLESAHEKDLEKSKKFYKLVKYVKANIDDKNNQFVQDFTQSRGLRADLIEIPEEFQDIDISDTKPQDLKRRPYRKQVIRTRTSRDLTNYDAWRSFDRQVVMQNGKHHGPGNLWLVPADLVKVFGSPCDSRTPYTGTGEYNFEDNNLDAFTIFDYKQTVLYHGLNREDEYYNNPNNLRKPFHKRKRKWPYVTEFWGSTDLHEFRFVCDDRADYRKFKRWLRQQLAKASDMTQSYDEMVRAKHGKDISICNGIFEEPAELQTQMAVHKYDFTYFMTKEELKAFKGEVPGKLKSPKMFDLSKAERVTVDREQLKKALEEEKHKLQDEI